ncbi:Hypothetical predicted protein [Mytilus galloprovincialis]|uniref:Uncharacterized protein n=1 Tax=Mytilus galloprovincialis TaxID=29158 RepID=A0A8B6CU27_MYTGA|nr:Hypothetical predicted protein [Mytilus galloprovincialis]
MGDLLLVPESSLQQPTTPIRQKLAPTVSFDNLVSHWDLTNLERVGLFYAEKPVDINTLLDKSLSYNSQVSHLSLNVETFKTILERYLNFDVSIPDDYSEGERREDRQARWTNEMEALARCKIEADKVYKYEEVIDNETELIMIYYDSKIIAVRRVNTESSAEHFENMWTLEPAKTSRESSHICLVMGTLVSRSFTVNDKYAFR